jgi:hypothetical protein
LNEEILYNKGNAQNIAEMLMSSDVPDKLVPTQVAFEEANEAANNNCIMIIGLHKKLEFFLTGLEAGSIMGSDPHQQG